MQGSSDEEEMCNFKCLYWKWKVKRKLSSLFKKIKIKMILNKLIPKNIEEMMKIRTEIKWK